MKSKKWTITADKFLTQEQISTLIRYTTDQRDLAFARNRSPISIGDFYTIRILLETGVRVQEFCDLDDGDLRGNKLTVRHGKGDKPRTILLTRGTAKVILEWIAIKPSLGFHSATDAPLVPNRYNCRYVTRGVQKRVKRVFKAAGLPECLHTHSLRHSYCSMLLSSGKVGLPTARENMGHSSLSVTNLYSHAVDNLDDVELFKTVGSENKGKYEPKELGRSKKTNDLVSHLLRKANQKLQFDGKRGS